MKVKFYLCAVLLCLSYGCGGIGDYIKELPGGYQFVSESNNDQVIIGHSNTIPANVISYTYNDDYILAAQRVMFDESDTVNNNLNVNIIQFWIIDVNNNILHGPFDLSEYMSQRLSLNIPKKLKLKIEL